MPRPQRIEYEGAFYHVMNRGRARQTIFKDHRYYQAFLDTLIEAHQRFRCVIHAYCLMGNHYHLLLETPNGNLGRIMRHINGVYTQRHNRLKHTDGPLFRGRYKAILVDKDAYLLRLTRYIHRNPIDKKQPMVKQLQDYPWSSYPAYINKAKSPQWLNRETTYKMLGHKQRYAGYRNYVSADADKEMVEFYNRGNLASIIGDQAFKSWIHEKQLPQLEAEEKGRIILSDISMEAIVKNVALFHKSTAKELLKVVKGPQKTNETRKVAMYLCQELADARLNDIAIYFNLGHPGSVSFITHQIRQKKREDVAFSRYLDELIKHIIKQAT
ncbi:MAG TPA: hypothetical protein ENK06_12865 [Gammaproteobacteria bacterium]|nr:hypothetical protein [Gammaproteobacteria bacterium]